MLLAKYHKKRDAIVIIGSKFLLHLFSIIFSKKNIILFCLASIVGQQSGIVKAIASLSLAVSSIKSAKLNFLVNDYVWHNWNFVIVTSITLILLEALYKYFLESRLKSIIENIDRNWEKQFKKSLLYLKYSNIDEILHTRQFYFNSFLKLLEIVFSFLIVFIIFAIVAYTHSSIDWISVLFIIVLSSFFFIFGLLANYVLSFYHSKTYNNVNWMVPAVASILNNFFIAVLYLVFPLIILFFKVGTKNFTIETFEFSRLFLLLIYLSCIDFAFLSDKPKFFKELFQSKQIINRIENKMLEEFTEPIISIEILNHPNIVLTCGKSYYLSKMNFQQILSSPKQINGDKTDKSIISQSAFISYNKRDENGSVCILDYIGFPREQAIKLLNRFGFFYDVDHPEQKVSDKYLLLSEKDKIIVEIVKALCEQCTLIAFDISVYFSASEIESIVTNIQSDGKSRILIFLGDNPGIEDIINN